MDLISTIIIGDNQSIANRVEFFAQELLATTNYFPHPDFIQLASEESKSIGIKHVENFKNQLYVKPYQSNHKIGIVYDAERLTIEAQNSLLKILEEPPRNTQIILTTTNEGTFLDTIKSRCVVEYIGQSGQNEQKLDIEEFIRMDLLDKFSFIDKLQNIKPSSERQSETESFLNDLHIYFKNLLKSNKQSREKIQSVLKLLDSTSRNLKSNSNFRLTLENLIINI